MKIVIAIDSFKGSLSSMQAGNAVKEAALRLKPDAAVVVKPLADGGEGTVEALAGFNAQIVELFVSDPIGRPVKAAYCILNDTNTAVIEMAASAGITLVSGEERNPLETTTYGVGELIRDAINRGCRRFIIGIGGSATNDGGTGMLTALGYEFLDGAGQPIPLGAKGLEKLYRIEDKNVLPQLKECTFRIACDVNNPLCGELGCSAVYGVQKGATLQMIRDMDLWLKSYALLAGADPEVPGAGAAGGLGFAFLAFTNAELKSGIDIVLEEIRLEQEITDADLVITGEGRLDSQSVMGKAPVGVAKLAKKYGKTVIAFSGCVTEEAEVCNDHGIDAFFPVLRTVCTLEEALNCENAYKNLKATAYQVLRLFWRNDL
ncbi:MAG: glycerate kinase [Oscillospiraceae bacterium]|nr:glycerate kinase [Oscillospiraceae bacterium]